MRGCPSRRALGVDEERRQARPLVGDLNRLDARPTRPCGGVAEAVHPATVGGEALGGLRLQEALAHVVVEGSPAEPRRCRDGVTRREALAPALLDGLRGPRPFLEPRAVIA